MKKTMSFVMALAMCFALIGEPVAFALENHESVAESVQMMDICDAEGNVITTVQMPARIITPVIGATIYYLGAVLMTYSGTAWILMNPDVVASMVEMAITAFGIAQEYIGAIKEAEFDGKRITSAVKTNGAQCQQNRPGEPWACLYTVG